MKLRICGLLWIILFLVAGPTGSLAQNMGLIILNSFSDMDSMQEVWLNAWASVTHLNAQQAQSCIIQEVMAELCFPAQQKGRNKNHNCTTTISNSNQNSGTVIKGNHNGNLNFLAGHRQLKGAEWIAVLRKAATRKGLRKTRRACEG